MDPSSHSSPNQTKVGRVLDVASEPRSDSHGNHDDSQSGSSGFSVAVGGNPFIGIQFKCCRTYGRIYRSADALAYRGHCPKCGKRIEIPIGPGGGSARFFSAS